tara:strand:+ start:11389 stop:11787 length:399 start_codon:yes stop_codon:yes gene_type:complete
MDFKTVFITAIIGIAAGIIASTFGADQADTILPGLILSGITPDFKIALGTTLLAIMPPTNAGAVYKFYKNGNVKITLAVILMIAATIASYFGAGLAEALTNKQQKIGLGIYLICTAIFQFYSAYHDKSDSKK